ncbi:hypothetical protein GCM10010532_077040 [Dactylosporangium siamense]|uniref:Uncharacterized protein n=1 Tax=Dactylosporangium siamense TaxID=685454 RepID=A0A919UDJ4_9ACTN|nr:hypothetical protein Dsi01nite_057360 [Dactylosporangium siamense]
MQVPVLVTAPPVAPGVLVVDGFLVGVLVASGTLLTCGDADAEAAGEGATDADAELDGRSPRSARSAGLRLPSIRSLAAVGSASSEPILTVATAPPMRAIAATTPAINGARCRRDIAVCRPDNVSTLR